MTGGSRESVVFTVEYCVPSLISFFETSTRYFNSFIAYRAISLLALSRPVRLITSSIFGGFSLLFMFMLFMLFMLLLLLCPRRMSIVVKDVPVSTSLSVGTTSRSVVIHADFRGTIGCSSRSCRRRSKFLLHDFSSSFFLRF